MPGILYGVGIGPGDPELLTLKAKRILDSASVIVFPGVIPEETIAYQIIHGVIDLSNKQLVGLSFPMTKDPEVLASNHKKGAEIIEKYLSDDTDVAFPTLGDPSVYSTFTYVNTILKEMGYQTEVIPGIPSFCDAAAKINIPLGETNQQIHIIPSSYGLEEALTLSGTKVLMKAGKKLNKVIKEASESGQQVILAENLGMANEKIVFDPDENTEAGYYTLLIVK